MSGTLLVRRTRALLRATGRDPVKMVDGLATNDINAVTSDRGVYTAFLTAKGRMVADARVFPADGSAPDDPPSALLLDVDPDALEELKAHLARFVPPLFARFEDVSGAWAVVGVYGPGARAAAEAGVGAITPEGPALPDDLPEHGVVPLGPPLSGFATRTRLTGDDGWELFVDDESADELEAAIQAAGAAPGSPADLDRRRVAAGRPAWGAELTGDVIPLEAGLLDAAISQTKGCYTGQEVIVRILHRGHVNRHLRRLRLEAGEEPLEPGTELFEPGNEKPRGNVTSMVRAPDPVGLGYVRREIDPPAVLRVGSPDGAPIRVEALDDAAFVND